MVLVFASTPSYHAEVLPQWQSAEKTSFARDFAAVQLHTYNGRMRLFLALIICVPFGVFMGLAGAADSGAPSPYVPMTLGGLLGLVLALAIGKVKPFVDWLYPPADDRPD